MMVVMAVVVVVVVEVAALAEVKWSQGFAAAQLGRLRVFREARKNISCSSKEIRSIAYTHTPAGGTHTPAGGTHN